MPTSRTSQVAPRRPRTRLIVAAGPSDRAGCLGDLDRPDAIEEPDPARCHALDDQEVLHDLVEHRARAAADDVVSLASAMSPRSRPSRSAGWQVHGRLGDPAERLARHRRRELVLGGQPLDESAHVLDGAGDLVLRVSAPCGSGNSPGTHRGSVAIFPRAEQPQNAASSPPSKAADQRRRSDRVEVLLVDRSYRCPRAGDRASRLPR